jgi:hypothetical protein
MEAENLAGLDRGGRAREEAEGRSAEVEQPSRPSGRRRLDANVQARSDA